MHPPISPRKEPKLSLSEYAERSLSMSGEDRVSTHKPSINSDISTDSGEVQTNVIMSHTVPQQNPQTSTPIRQDVKIEVELNSATGAVGFSPVNRSVGNTDGPTRRRKRVSFIDPLTLRVPLAGFEVMEQRAKFTVSIYNCLCETELLFFCLQYEKNNRSCCYY